MSYRCKVGKCKYTTGSRKDIRSHVREVHKIKGKPLAPPTAERKYDQSEISESYERVRK